MKKFPTYLLLVGALLSPAVLSAKDFEGKVTMTMKSAKKGDEVIINYSMKGGLTRIDMPQGQGKKGDSGTGAVIFDMPKQEMTILMDSGKDKMYMVRPMPKPEEQPEHQALKSDVTFEKTGVTEKILGYTCEKYLAKSKDGTAEIWSTDQLGNYMGANAGGNPMARRGSAAQQQAWEKMFQGKSMFPLRVVTFDKNGKEDMHMEATSVEKQSLPDSLFQPGPEYTKFEMPKMPGMGEMMKGMIPGH